MLLQIQTRFSERNRVAMNGFYCFPVRVVSSVEWRGKFTSFLELYEDDLPESRYIKTELTMWEEHWHMSENTPPENVSSLLLQVDKIAFPNIYTALQILATIPVTTCTCERTISTLRRLKTYLRSTMIESRLNGLALLHVHREINLEPQTIIDRFANKHPRKMKLLDILDTDSNDHE